MKHSVVERQLRRLGISRDVVPTADQWARLLERVDDAYAQADQDRYTLERSLSISSREMQRAYQNLRATSDDQLGLEREKIIQLDEARARLERSEANFKTLVDRSPHPVFVHQHDVMRYANPAFATLLGYVNAAAAVGSSALDGLVHPDDRAKVDDYRARRDSGDEPAPYHMRWLRVDGEELAMEVSSAHITYDGAPATLVFGYDITEQRRVAAQEAEAQEAVRRSEARYRLLFDGSPMATFLFDAETFRFVEVNEAALALYGYSREEFLSMRVFDLKPPEDIAHIVANVGDGSKTGVYCGVHRHRRRDGVPLDIRITSRPVMVAGRRTMLAFGIDVTATLKLEDQLRQAQKMEAIGQLAGGVAHDFNNILAVILADAEVVLETLDEADAVRDVVKDIESATHRAASLTRQLLTFSRRNPCQPKIFKIDPAVMDVQKMLARLIGENIVVSLNLEARSGCIELDPTHIEQVLLNLAVNARDAMPSGGYLAIRTCNVELDEVAAAGLGLGAGRFVRLSVVDDGCGMDKAIQARIFEPFFTTKAVGRGTGLGLSTVFGIVQRGGGAIAVASEPGQGTTFDIYFPRVAVDGDSIVPIVKPRAAGGTETVLVVEDDEQLRKVLKRILSSRGYVVLDANCANAALDVLAGHERVDLVLTDLVMPGMDGRTMAEIVLKRHHGTRVVYMSGYTEHVSMKGAPIGPDDDFLCKPFTAEQMSAVVRRALERKAEGAGNSGLH